MIKWFRDAWRGYTDENLLEAIKLQRVLSGEVKGRPGRGRTANMGILNALMALARKRNGLWMPDFDDVNSA